MLTLVILLIGVGFALTMGGSGMAPAFAVCTGAKLLNRGQALALFTVAVVIGAVVFGGFVAKTLGGELVPATTLDPTRTLAVLVAATAALLVANLLKIPQSTSWVTVAGISVVGLQAGTLQTEVLFYKLFPAWVGLPLLAFVITALVVRFFYPVRPSNSRFHVTFHVHRWKLRALAIASSCYVAVAIGANNVANVVGPLSASGVVELGTGMWLAAPLFGLGALLFRGPMKTMGVEIVPIGTLTACLVNLVVGTILLAASRAGVPQSLVQLNAAAVLGISLVKEGAFEMMPSGVLRRMAVLWLATPVLAFGMTWLVLEVMT